MTKSASLTVTLPGEMADLVRAKVASGEFATETDVVERGLKVLVEQDLAIDRWLHEQVAPAYDAYKADPSSAQSLDDVFARLEKEMRNDEGGVR